MNQLLPQGPMLGYYLGEVLGQAQGQIQMIYSYLTLYFKNNTLNL